MTLFHDTRRYMTVPVMFVRYDADAVQSRPDPDTHEGTMRADRLLSILLLLQVNRKLTASQLARRLEVSPRTVHLSLIHI